MAKFLYILLLSWLNYLQTIDTSFSVRCSKTSSNEYFALYRTFETLRTIMHIGPKGIVNCADKHKSYRSPVIARRIKKVKTTIVHCIENVFCLQTPCFYSQQFYESKRFPSIE